VTERIISFAGFAVFLVLAWAISEDRRRVNWRLVFIALALQAALAVVVLRTPWGSAFFEKMRGAFDVIADATGEGAGFLFGPLASFFMLSEDAVLTSDLPVEFNVFAFQVLPVVIVVSSITGVLYHFRIIQTAVRAMAWLMRRTLKTSGPETFGTALMVFLGIESMPSLKAYLQTMSRSELCTVMTAFMSTVAANVMIIYATFGAKPEHILAASLMSAPAAILIAKLMVPETEEPAAEESGRMDASAESHNVVDAAAKGASDGLKLALNIGALLIAFVSLVYLVNLFFSAVTGYTFTDLMGYAFYPFAFLMGVPAADVGEVAQLLGTKTVINEFLAYSDMNALIEAGQLQERSIMIATYALCGFANPGSLGILIAGLTGLVPERRKEITALGLKAFVGGTLAVLTTACVVGVIG
jgi:CNT family concentrative nucleoside transporter